MLQPLKHKMWRISSRKHIPIAVNRSQRLAGRSKAGLGRRQCSQSSMSFIYTLAMLALMASIPTTTGDYLRPEFLRKNLERQVARVGHDVTFTCQVKNIGSYKVAWLHSEKGIIAVHPDVLGNNDRIKSTHSDRDSWSLTVKSVQESDAGKYICQINTEESISISGTLSVEVPPDIIDEHSSSDTLATEGMSVTLSCEATGTPIPTITWKRERKEGRQQPELIRLCGHHTPNRRKYGSQGGHLTSREHKCREVAEYEGSVLELNSLNRFDAGGYLCIANNGVSPSVSKRVQLYVDFPPTLWITHQLVSVQQGNQVTLECMTSGHPPPIVIWQKDFTNIPHHRTPKYLPEKMEGSPGEHNILMKLTIFNATKQDSGKYRCQAKNSLGETSGEIDLSVLEVTTSTRNPPISTQPTHGLGVWDIWDHSPYTTESVPIGNDYGRRRTGGNERQKMWGRENPYSPMNNIMSSGCSAVLISPMTLLALATMKILHQHLHSVHI